ncbi:hypothetical protein Taro_013933 [Colocasia esculenta]|uniref:Uncharacterized protein n=1 Tax=Colocasia esculenta TaxID=4460 RepID=A0A843UD21_COLES|nr:hypothetical protein [Colocasia esculenta]
MVALVRGSPWARWDAGAGIKVGAPVLQCFCKWCDGDSFGEEDVTRQKRHCRLVLERSGIKRPRIISAEINTRLRP